MLLQERFEMTDSKRDMRRPNRRVEKVSFSKKASKRGVDDLLTVRPLRRAFGNVVHAVKSTFTSWRTP